MASTVSPSSARQFQVVVWGATGFTGQLVAKHIANSYQGKIRWALAGRDAGKLEKVRSELVKVNPDCKDVPILVAKPDDSASMGSVLSKTDVVIAMAGPFAKYGNTVVEQCVEQGTHYCDITGEVTWVKRNVLKYHKRAQDKRVKIVHCCGFDSVPSDIGTLMMAEHLRSLGKRTAHVYCLVKETKGGASGGTIHTAQTLIATEKVEELRRCGSDAYYLAEGVGGKRGTAKPAPLLPLYVQQAGTWAAPFVMEFVNNRIVHLSNALKPYGSDFKHTEMLAGGAGWAGWAWSQATTLAVGALGVAMVKPFNIITNKLLPAPGQGPSPEQQESGRWRYQYVAVSEEEPGAKPTVVRGVGGDNRDPGYLSTSRMVLEAALCMALDADKLRLRGCVEGGVLTPATAMGTVLIDRLRAAGFIWQVEGAEQVPAQEAGAKKPLQG